MKRESLFGVAIRCGQGLTDEYGNQSGQVKNEASPHAYSLFFLNQTMKVKALQKQAEQHILRGNYKEAIEIYDKILKEVRPNTQRWNRFRDAQLDCINGINSK